MIRRAAAASSRTCGPAAGLLAPRMGHAARLDRDAGRAHLEAGRDERGVPAAEEPADRRGGRMARTGAAPLLERRRPAVLVRPRLQALDDARRRPARDRLGRARSRRAASPSSGLPPAAAAAAPPP